MTREEAIKWLEKELEYLHRAPDINGCGMQPQWKEQIDVFTMAISALREQ